MSNRDRSRGEYQHLGDLSAVEPPYRVPMRCDDCRVAWDGCWDAFECPKCGRGELPWKNDEGG